MSSRIDQSSVSVAPNIPLSLFSAPPTQEGILENQQWDEVLSTQATEDTRDGDVLEIRIQPCSQGEAYVLQDSWLKVEGYVDKQRSAPMRDFFNDDEQIAPVEGFPEISLFSRALLTMNNVPVNAELGSGSLDQAEWVDAMMNRSARSLSASQSCCGWSRDELDYSPGAHMRIVPRITSMEGAGANAATGGRMAQTLVFSITNKDLRAAKLRPSDAAGTFKGDLRAGLKCRIMAIANQTGAANTGVPAYEAAFNHAYGGQEFIIMNKGADLANSGEILPNSDDDTGATEFVLQHAGSVGGANVAADAAVVSQNKYLTNGAVVPGGDAAVGGAAPGLPAAKATPDGGALAFVVDRVAILLLPDERSYSALQVRRSIDWPLGMNLSAKKRRQRFLSGGAHGSSLASTNYQKFSVAYTPMIAAWRSTPYLPPQVLSVLRLTRNNFNRSLIDYGVYDAAVTDPNKAAGNLKFVITKASMMMRRIRLSPQVDAALLAQYQQGSVLKLPGQMIRQFSQRIETGTGTTVLRSFLAGIRARKYVVYAVPDAVSTVGQGALPGGGRSSLDIGFETGVYPTSMHMVLNGQIFPVNRLEQTQNTNALSLLGGGPGAATKYAGTDHKNESFYNKYTADSAEAWWMYRQSCAAPDDPALSSTQWLDRPLYVIDCSLTSDPNVVDPQDQVTCELHLTLNKAVTEPHNIVVLSYTDAITEIDGSGQVTHSDA